MIRIPIVICALGAVPKRFQRGFEPLEIEEIIKGSGGLGSWRTSGDHLNHSILEIGQNTEKCPGDLRRLAVTQTPVKDHQKTLV